jgi:hypothetical protein
MPAHDGTRNVGAGWHILIVQQWAFDDVVRAIRASWSIETCDPADRDNWMSSNPSRGQCGTTALVLNDLFGGELMLAEVRYPDGSRQGVHYWNVLPDGSEVDLTSQQFNDDETVQAGRRLSRPDGEPKRCAEEYYLLRKRVLVHLADCSGPASERVALS